jgi:hypothetical protein
LLLVDYIFDWARDLYRHSIARLLKVLCKKVSEKQPNDAVSISLDTDFSSINQEVEQIELDPPRHQGIANWQQQMELESPAPQFPAIETPGLCEETFKEWKKIDTITGAFRDPTIIETSFECIQFRDQVFQTLLAPFITSDIPEERLVQFDAGLRDAVAEHPVMISDDVLLYLEEQWTGNRSLLDDRIPASRVRHAIIVFYLHFTDRWQPRRAMACIVFDQNIENLVRHRPQEVTTRDVAGLIHHLRGQSVKDNLVAAIETRSVFLKKQAGGTPGFESQPSSPFGIPALFQILQIISSEGPRGSLERLTRFSSLIEYQKSDSLDSTRSFFTPFKASWGWDYPICRPYWEGKYALVYSTDIREATEASGIPGPE